MSRPLLFPLLALSVAVNAAEPAADPPAPVAHRAVATAGAKKNAGDAATLKPQYSVIRLPAPKFSETTAVRQPDGSLAMVCTERANPQRFVARTPPADKNVTEPQQ